MGKAGRKHQEYYQEWDRSQWSSSPSWAVWPGARRTWESRQVGDSPRFPTYDADWQPEPHSQIQVLEERRYTPEFEAPKKVAAVQKAVNLARKQDTRVTRLRREQQERERKWERYKTALKLSFNKEKIRYEKDQQRLADDLAQAMSEQEEAHKLMEHAALTLATKEPDVEMLGDDAEWEDMIKGRPAVKMGVQKLQAEIQEMLEHRQQQQVAAVTPTRSTMAPPRSPAPAHRVSERPAPARPVAAPTPHAARDPYMAQSTTPPVAAPESRVHAELQQEYRQQQEAMASPKPRPKNAETQRRPIKALPSQVVHTPSPGPGLGGKLDSKRAAILQQTQQANAGTMGPGQLTPGPTGPTCLIADDDDDLTLEGSDLGEPPPEVD